MVAEPITMKTKQLWTNTTAHSTADTTALESTDQTQANVMTPAIITQYNNI